VEEKERLSQVVKTGLASCPRVKIVDEQKPVYQAVFGIDHKDNLPAQ